MNLFDVTSLLFSGLSPLHLAVLRGQKDIAKRLLDAGADINAMVSCFSAHESASIRTITYSTDLCSFSFQDIKSGQSPLMHAVEKNNADMVCFLIEVTVGFGV